MAMEAIPMRNALRLLLTQFRAMSRVRRGLVLSFAGVVCLVVLAQFSRLSPPPGLKEAARSTREAQHAETGTSALQANDGSFEDMDKFKDLSEPMSAPLEPRKTDSKQLAAALPFATPLIAHTAQLALATKEFAQSRASLEEILERHRGYAARLRMVGRRSGSVLSATLRVPSPELGATVSELKSLGEVEQEEQAADEITQQRADLEARLSNAQGTLRQLQELLKKQTYPDGNVRELQRQIASAKAEVNRLEAERQSSEHRVIFANLQFSLREEIPAPVESLGAQFHSAASAGFKEAAASVSALLLFLIGRGPVVLLWIMILFLPARYVWRRSMTAAIPAAAPVAQG
jgi:DNA repair exonuclease SbcCD ATPase subunit